VRRAIVVVAASLAMLAAACSGRSNVTDAEWVSSVCTKAKEWDAQIERAFSELPEVNWSTENYADNAAAIRSDSYGKAVDKFARTIGGVLDDVGQLPSPATDASRRGEELLDAWQHRLQTRVNEFQSAGRELPRDADYSEVRSAVFKIYPVVYARPVQVIPYVGVAVGGELKTLFERTRACRQVGEWRAPSPASNSPHERVPGEKWASRICTRLSAYERELASVYTDVRAMRIFPSVITRSRVLADIATSRRAISQVWADLKAIPAPNIPKGRPAKVLIEAISDLHLNGADEELAKIRARLMNDPSHHAIVRLLGGEEGIFGLQGALLHALAVGGFDVFLRQFHKPRAAEAFQAAEACQRS